jgi:hypothetical protein
MDLSPSNFVSIGDILADVLKVVRDSDFKTSSKGWYTSQIQQALEELSFDTFFDEQTAILPVSENLRVEMPKGAFNLKQAYLFNGDKCTIQGRVNVYFKRNFINSCTGNGYVARDNWRNEGDPFYTQRGGVNFSDNNFSGRSSSRTNGENRPERLYYCGIQNGLIMLSENCRKFDNLYLVYSGIMTDIGEAPVVPQFFRQAVKSWVLVSALQEKMTETIATKEYAHWANLQAKYERDINDPYNGSWVKAERRSKKLNFKERVDIKEYLTRMRY